jgi:ATP-dependent helicase/nuclease subunit B
LQGLADAGEVTLAHLLAAHRTALQGLGFDLAIAEREDARALAEVFGAIEATAIHAPALGLIDYADVFDRLLADRTVRPLFDGRARIRILGPLEARLLDCERMVLGGLNEGTWPPETHADAWLNRPMRKKLGLDLPERRIGLSAHDFTQAMGAHEIVLTRARRQNGVETVASRFLQRLAAVAPKKAWDRALERGGKYLAFARNLERPQQPKPIDRPAPRPPRAARPARLSVTDIETLVRDPYSIYARYVLALEPLEEIDADPGAAERGTLLHQALADFARAFPEKLPADALDRLLACGRDSFARMRDFPSVAAIWWPRFERVARWFVEQERARRHAATRTLAEIAGKIEFDIKGQIFTLTARADRIDLRRDNSVAILDYKTGEAPSLSQALAGLAPQLPLEAAIARAGGFPSISANTKIAEIAVMRLSGGDPPGEVRSLDPAQAKRDAKELAEKHRISNCDDLAAFARARVETLLAAFANEKTPYHSIPRPKWRGRFGQYDHLARIREWSAEGDEE